MNDAKVTVIIPAYNEAQTVGDLISKIKDLYPDFEIIVVNDGSTDGTGEIAEEAGALVYSHPYTVGNGAAVKSGIRIASGEILVFMDGDGQHVPEEIEILIKPILQDKADFIIGSRILGKREKDSIFRLVGIRVFSFAINLWIH